MGQRGRHLHVGVGFGFRFRASGARVCMLLVRGKAGLVSGVLARGEGVRPWESDGVVKLNRRILEVRDAHAAVGGLGRYGRGTRMVNSRKGGGGSLDTRVPGAPAGACRHLRCACPRTSLYNQKWENNIS